MDGTQCAHVFEITQPECLVCAGRNRSCEKFVERRMSDEKENEPCDRDRPDAGQCGATDVLVRADRPTRAVGLGRVRLDRITRRQEQLGNESLAVVMVPDRNGMPQTEKARQLRAEALPEGVPVEFRVPAMRTPRTRREQQLKMVGDRAATMAWQLMALACVQELGFGAERLNRLYREMRHNYEQLNEWGKADGIEVAMEKLRRCACEALQTEEIVVENIDDEKTVQTLSRSYQAQEDELLKRAVMMAAGRRAGKQGGAALPLSGDEVRRKIEAAKAQMDTGAYRRRG